MSTYSKINNKVLSIGGWKWNFWKLYQVILYVCKENPSAFCLSSMMEKVVFHCVLRILSSLDLLERMSYFVCVIVQLLVHYHWLSLWLLLLTLICKYPQNGWVLFILIFRFLDWHMNYVKILSFVAHILEMMLVA